jgi:hypothetical protein
MAKYSDDFLQQLIEGGITVKSFINMFVGTGVSIILDSYALRTDIRDDGSRIVIKAIQGNVASFEWR